MRPHLTKPPDRRPTPPCYRPLVRWRGFTLVELMVVVAIVGLLAAIAVPRFLKNQCSAKQKECAMLLSAVYITQSAYFGEHDRYAITLGDFNSMTRIPPSKRYGVFLFDSNPFDNPSAFNNGTYTGFCTPSTVTGATAMAWTAAACANVDQDTAIDECYLNDANRKALVVAGQNDCDI